VSGTSGSKAGRDGLGSKTAAGVKKATTSAKKHIVPAIGALAKISSEESQESSPHGQAFRASAPEVQSRLEPYGKSSEPHCKSPVASVPGPDPEASLGIAAPLRAGSVSIGCLKLYVHSLVLPNDILTFVAAHFRCLRYRCWCSDQRRCVR
jgi:hypothetical protein